MVYTVVGDQHRQIEYDKILDRVRKENPGITEIFYDATQGELDLFLRDISINSMFDNKKLIVFKRCEALKKISDFLEMVNNFSINNKIIILDIEKSGNNFTKKSEKLALGLGELIIATKEQANNKIIKFIKDELSLEREDAHRLFEMVGDNFSQVKQEVSKIKLFLGEEQFSFQKIEGLISVQKEYSIFDMLEKLLKGDKKSPIEFLRRENLYTLFLYNLGTEIKTILTLNLLVKSGKLSPSRDFNQFKNSYNNVNKYFKNHKGFMHPYAVFKKLDFLKKYSAKKCKRLLELIWEVETKKNKGQGDEQQLIELLLMKI